MSDYLIRSRDQNHLVVAYNQEQAYRLIMECDGIGLIYIFGNLAESEHDEKESIS
ncbi:phage terminase large subunit [Niallia nealsonii AAU1]|nr:phage terminase large subunit [Niallia nealsonii AAU1]